MEIVKNTQTIITNFTNLIDINKKYSNKELVNILNKVYNDVYKIKKEPTKYNLFVKENISKLKDTYPDLSRQNLMRKIGELWKQKQETSNNNENTSDKDNENISDKDNHNTSDIKEKKDDEEKKDDDTLNIKEKVLVKKSVKKKK
jgi:hypothetical protein